MAVNITRSFKLYGWCSRIRGVESGGAVEGLPVHTFPTDDGGVDMKCPTEIAISDRREAELAKNGFMPLLHRKNTDIAAFIGAQSLQKPFEYTDPDATANANLSARLPYLFACLPVRALPEVHRARQDRLLQGARRRWRSGSTSGSSQYVDWQSRHRRARRPRPSSRWPPPRSRSRRSKAIPGTTRSTVLPAAALSARGPDRVAAAGVQAAVGEGREVMQRGRARYAVSRSRERDGRGDDPWPLTCSSRLTDARARRPTTSTRRRSTSLSWSWGMSQSGSAHMGGGAGAGKVNVQRPVVHEVHRQVVAGPHAVLLNGKHLKRREADGAQGGREPARVPDRSRWKTSIVSSVSNGGSGGEDRLTGERDPELRRGSRSSTPRRTRRVARRRPSRR